MNSIPAQIISKYNELKDFLFFVQKHFTGDHSVRTAAALSYTSLLSLVPLMAVMFSTLAAFPVFQGLEKEIEAFIFKNFVPALGETVQTYLHEFSEKASGLRAIGISFLFITVLLMMNTIENAFNVIWRVRAKRKPVTRFMTYWAILTLGPLLLGAGFVATSYLASLPIFSEVDQTLGIKRKFLFLIPFLMSTVAFFLIYQLLPNRTVSTKSALIGGLVAGILFEIAKRLFAYYVVHFPSQQAIYGAFATIPIFLLWIYLSWVIILLGAEITRCHMIYHRYVGRVDDGRRNLFVDAYRVTGQLWKAQITGKPCSVSDLLVQEPDMNDDRVYEILRSLREANWIQRTEDGGWVLLRDLGDETMLSLYRALPGGLPLSDKDLIRDDLWNKNLYTELGKAFGSLTTSMKTPLKNLYDQDQTSSES